ncbi:putative F-box associated domain, type 1 [Medicago truncatula]|nr:putative F-box associated domain, type 1 [Medicago truncatula]
MDGVCHWVCGYCEGEKSISSLVSFDLNNEMFFITPLPSDHKLHSTQSMVLNGFVALISLHEKTKTIHISILGEVGVKESWIKLFVVEQPYVGFPTGVGMKGEIFFEKEDNEIVWFDLTTNMIKELGLNEIVRTRITKNLKGTF